MNLRPLPARPLATLAIASLLLGALFAGLAHAADDATLARGRYVVRIGGCNDCHTPGYPQSGGTVPEREWLTGVPVGWRGPWGTTYAANLRLAVQTVGEDQWLVYARTERRPPMPWFALRDMSDDDLRAMYRYIRSLGPAGQPMPAYLPPGATSDAPYMDVDVKNLPPPKKP